MTHRLSSSVLSLVAFALVAAFSVTGCDSVVPTDGLHTETTATAPASLEDCDPNDIECMENSGGSGGGGTPAQYRITAVLGVAGDGPSAAVGEAFTRHEQLMGSTWVKVDGQNNGVRCYVNGVLWDEDVEASAGYTDVRFSFWAGDFGPGTYYVSCNHFSTSPNGVTHTETTNQSIVLAL